MLAFRRMLVGAAESAGMKVPPDPDDFQKEEYPHFFAFCILQLGRRLTSWQEPHDNAKIIAAIPEAHILTMTVQDFINQGVTVVFN